MVKESFINYNGFYPMEKLNGQVSRPHGGGSLLKWKSVAMAPMAQ